MAGEWSPAQCLVVQGGGKRTEGYDGKVEWSNVEEDRELFAEVLDSFTSKILTLECRHCSCEMFVHVLQVIMQVVNLTYPKVVKSVVKHLLVMGQY